MSRSYTVCNITKEFVTFDEHGDEIRRQSYTESKLVSSDDTIMEAEKKFIDRDSYLASVEWQTKRQAVLKRDNYICQKCGSAKNHNVHHLTYEHFGREPLEDLITLCRECHEKVHQKDIDAKTDKKTNATYTKSKVNNSKNKGIEIMAEEYLIAFILQDKRVLEHCLCCVLPSDFRLYGKLYDCICGTYEEDPYNFDVEKVIKRMETSGDLYKKYVYNKKNIRALAQKDTNNIDYNKCMDVVVGEEEE